MTITELAKNWAEKYDQPKDVTDTALTRAATCDACDNKNDQICAICGCRLIRIAFEDRSNPCPLHKFNEEVPS